MRDYAYLFADRIPRCHYCAERVYAWNDPIVATHKDRRASRDHTKPKSAGGIDWVVCCVGCNAIKAHDPYEMFLAFMVEGKGREMRRHERKKAYHDFREKIIHIGVLAFQEALAEMKQEADGDRRKPAAAACNAHLVSRVSRRRQV